MDWNWKQWLFYGFMAAFALTCVLTIGYLLWGIVRDAMKKPPDGK
ncbi:MAG: hypothetical protein Q7S16_00655 [bacterium]|nr:hypothetical protein [bacterium]